MRLFHLVELSCTTPGSHTYQHPGVDHADTRVSGSTRPGCQTNHYCRILFPALLLVITPITVRLKKFIANNKDRDDMVGDLCSDLMRDKKFKSLHTEDEKQEFIMIVGNIHEHIQDTIIQLFKEYSGEEVVFEEEEEEEEEWI